MDKKIRVLVVDDSAMVRKVLTDGLNGDPRIKVVGSAHDPYIARDKIVELRPDVLTLDVEMPRMDGVEFLRKLMPQYPIPVVMVSSLTQRGQKVTLDALEAGAVDFVAKPTSNLAMGLSGMMNELCRKVFIASKANVSHWKGKRLVKNHHFQNKKPSAVLSGSTDKIIAIGASTGGTEAIRTVLEGFPATTPGVVIVQHMPPDFTEMFAERLDSLVPMTVKHAKTGDRIMTGRVLIAPGGIQMKVKRSGGLYEVVCEGEEKVSGHCPSVDVLFHSVADQVGDNAFGIMLTGMGSDGADGMVAMRKAGASNIAQDEASCIVFGMPREALKRGGAEKLVPLERIPEYTLSHFVKIAAV